MKYKSRSAVIEATQWFKNGDHPKDGSECFTSGPYAGEFLEGKVVRYCRTPECDGQFVCKHCHFKIRQHGWIDTPEGGHTVCPGDWIITGEKGEYYPCKPHIFSAFMEKEQK